MPFVQKIGLSNIQIKLNCREFRLIKLLTNYSLKVCDLNDLNEIETVLTVDDEQAIDWMEWSDDGQMLAMVAPSESIHVYLTKLTILGDSYGTRLAFLSSLLEVTVSTQRLQPLRRPSTTF